ncbi:MAG TPA: type II secretion system F family protein [Armatimonadota bacterium]|jgi:tight adherence protein B
MNAWSISALAFVGASALTGAILQLLNEADYRRVEKRIQRITQDTLSTHEGLRQVERQEHSSALAQLGGYTTLRGLLERAGLNWQPGEFMVFWLSGAFALAIAGWLLWGPLAAVAGIALVFIGGWITLLELQHRRLRQFEKNFPDALMLIASSLRSGYGLLRSIQAIRDEMKPPISTEFGKVFDETALGFSIQEGLLHLSQRVPLPDLGIAVTGMLIHLDVGGNLAEVIEIVAATIRERQRIRAEVTTLTAEGRLSGVILFLLPIVMAFVLSLLNPSYMSALTHTSFGHILIFCAATLQCLGGLVIMRMIRIDF